jgi:nickel superoxide dismutase
MSRMDRLLHWAEEVFPPKVTYAHCDLPCGVYDPAQARIEAESVKACQEKFRASEDESFRQRAVMIKEERAELVKHHLWVLWTDYFKAEHLQRVPQLHVIFSKATKAAGAAKKSNDPADGQKLLDAIAEVDAAFRATKA